MPSLSTLPLTLFSDLWSDILWDYDWTTMSYVPHQPFAYLRVA